METLNVTICSLSDIADILKDDRIEGLKMERVWNKNR
jgi:hypothetical protein